jgi:hypothetical protein
VCVQMEWHTLRLEGVLLQCGVTVRKLPCCVGENERAKQ